MIKKLNLLPLFAMLMPAMFMLACEEKVDEAVVCVSNLTCGDQKTCFKGRCVGYEIDTEKDSYTLYKEEFHYRLVNACGACHTSEKAATNENSATPDQPYYIPPMPIGEPGYWRIFSSALDEDKIKQSYETTLLQLNSLDPLSSPLLAYGRGQYTLGITDENGIEYAHPALYQSSVYDQKGNLIYVIDVDYQRTIEWVKAWAKKYNQEQGIEPEIDAGMTGGMIGGIIENFTGGMPGGTTGGMTGGMTSGTPAGVIGGMTGGTPAGVIGGMTGGTPAGMPSGMTSGTEAGMSAGTPQQPQPTGNRLDATLFNELVKPAYTKAQACLSCHKGTLNGFQFNPSTDLAELQSQIDTIIKPLINFNNVDQSLLFKKLESQAHKKPRANTPAFIAQTKLWIEQSNR
jgi:cytochrome c553